MDRYPAVPVFWSDDKALARKVAQTVNGLLLGRMNNVYSVTLTADATSTVLIAPACTVRALVLLTPQSATAAAASGVWAGVEEGQITIHHDADSATDRTFAVAFFG